MPSLADLEEIGSAEIGAGISVAPQTTGGRTNLLVTRRFKVRSDAVQDYLFQILDDPVSPVMDRTFTDAYLIDQSVSGKDKADGVLTCVFAQVPTPWNQPSYQPIPFPGCGPSNFYTPRDFKFRSSPTSVVTQCRQYHEYFYGPSEGIPTYPLFQPVDEDGNRVSVITDYTIPSADYYISACAGRQEIVSESVVIPWRGFIYCRRTLYAIAK